jgi:uncharacterized protein involved in response to NO
MNVPALFNSPFRFWFFSGSICASLLILPWVAQYLVPITWQPFHSLFWWHQHEMIYAIAVPFILGFLLTASQNWTGEAPINTQQLIIVGALWWLARLALLLNLPAPVVLVLDVAPLVICTLLLALVLIRNKNYRNLVMVALLGLLAVSDAIQILNPEHVTAWARLSLLTVIFLMVVFAGRVVPFFTAKGLGINKIDGIPLVEKSLLLTQALATLALPFYPALVGLKVLAGMIACLHFIRWARWQNQAIYRTPLLWSLHSAYLMIALGWLAVALRGLDSLTLHGLALGGMGVMIIAFSGRVSLAHTGRPLAPSRFFSVALALIFAAVIFRVILPMIFNVHSVSLMYIVPGILWALGFLTFTLTYALIWLRPRLDGNPG